MDTFSRFFWVFFFSKDSFSATGKGLIAIHTALKLRIYLHHRDTFLYFPQFSLAPGEEKKWDHGTFSQLVLKLCVVWRVELGVEEKNW